MRSERYRPYVRRANGREMATSIRMATRLAFYRLLKKPFYVMVQRGFPLLAMECGPSRRELEEGILSTKSFRVWSRDVMRRCQGKGKGGARHGC